MNVSRILLFSLLFPLLAFARKGPQAQPEGECTLAMLRAERTTDGRMVIWKNRDVSNRNQVARLLTGPNFRFVGIGYGDVPGEVWGGVNTAGFAVANSNAWNLAPLTEPADDGNIQTRALGLCWNLEQFREILNETDTLNGGRTNPSCFFAFDSSGAMSIFEADARTWWEYPLTASNPNGYLVRANYAYGADTTNNPLGFYRNDRARWLYQRAVQAGLVPLDTVFRIMRDIAPEGWPRADYPLPYLGQNGNYAYGYASMYGSINRRNTASAMVIQGGKWTPSGWSMPVCWFFLGPPATSMAVPVWPNQLILSPLLSGATAPICNEAIAIYDSIKGYSQSLPTYFFINGNAGYWNYTNPREATIRAAVQPHLSHVMTSDYATFLSDSIATYSYQSMNRYYGPTIPNMVITRAGNGRYQVYWNPVTRDYRKRPFPAGTSVRYIFEYAPAQMPEPRVYQTLMNTTSTSFYLGSNPLEYVYRVNAVVDYTR